MHRVDQMLENGLMEEITDFYMNHYLPLYEHIKHNQVIPEIKNNGYGERVIATLDDLFVCGIYQTIGFKEFLGIYMMTT